MPTNSDDPDSLRRNLDCAVINWLHFARERLDEPAIDTVKGIFFEGGKAFSGSSFREKTHIQICVRNSNMIKGVFRVADSELR